MRNYTAFRKSRRERREQRQLEFRAISEISPFLKPEQREVLLKTSVARWAEGEFLGLVNRNLNPEHVSRNLRERK